ncbi:MAG TPA: DUF262 domain-containing protein [Brevefilum sp.]|nr:DUF262 domain-containing protein [Brevefilum sp.]HOR19514.1 DUF262 domain-containing protein [Brevefilum sp.]HPL69157.1 DUF262 domain-containing protein [Brevefilum sp.]
MKVELHELTIREVTENYVDNAEEGVLGYNGRLNIRPKYQREFVYDDKKRNAVIDSIQKSLPLNVMYWAVNEDGSFEVLDGQQRTVSFCQYVNNDYSIDNRFFHNLTETEKQHILNYKLMIYFCEGDDKEKLDWFRIVNIAGERLYDQELRNAVYTGPWLSDAKLKFSKTNCAAYLLAKDYVIGSPIRQELLEIALKWISKGEIEAYMAAHQHDPNANELWMYFRSIIEWVRLTFPNYRREMKGVDWGSLYDQFKNEVINTRALANEVGALMMDDDVTRKRGIYPYVLTRNPRHLNIRAFSDNQKREAYERQKGVCVRCGKQFEISQMEADHITPWHLGGKTHADNCQMLCKQCNREKSGV